MSYARDFAFDTAADTTMRLARLRRVAWLLDAAMRLPGTRFRCGLNGLIGLTPGFGDVAMALVSLYIVYEAYRLGVPRAKLGRMVGNIVIEAAAGSVPVLGDLFDIVFKANLRNVAIVEHHFGVTR